VTSDSPISGTVYLDYLDWSGVPDTYFRRPDGSGQMWLRAWVNAVEDAGTWWPEAFHLSQSRDIGLFLMGGRTWRDYTVTSSITARVARSFGLAARVQGLLRCYMFLLTSSQKAQIVKRLGETTVLAETEFEWELERPYQISLVVSGTEVAGWIDGKKVLQVSEVAERRTRKPTERARRGDAVLIGVPPLEKRRSAQRAVTQKTPSESVVFRTFR